MDKDEKLKLIELKNFEEEKNKISDLMDENCLDCHKLAENSLDSLKRFEKKLNQNKFQVNSFNN